MYLNFNNENILTPLFNLLSHNIIISKLMQRLILTAQFCKSKPNPFQRVAESVSVGDKKVTFYNLPALKDDRY